MHELRCHSCSNLLDRVSVAMLLAMMFKASRVDRVARVHVQEKRKRCPKCGWVNVFIPAGSGERYVDRVEVKAAVA